MFSTPVELNMMGIRNPVSRKSLVAVSSKWINPDGSVSLMRISQSLQVQVEDEEDAATEEEAVS